MKNLDLKFEQWKKRKLDEGFLDGEEEKPVAAEDEAPAAETEKRKLKQTKKEIILITTRIQEEHKNGKRKDHSNH
jgi:hypothetical protein